MSRMIDWGASPAEKPPLPPISGVNHDATANRRATARVLVVEDDYFIAMEIEDALRNAGYEVVGLAATATEAEAMARNTGPHMTIMDIRLAGRRDGVEAATELYNKLGIRSLFATAHEDAEMRRRAAAARPLGWLAKPFSPTMLIDAVKAALAQL